jgi:hypothetical protein
VSSKYRLRSPALLALPLALAASACSEFFTDPYEWGTVEVTVAFDTGEPVPGVDLVFFTGARLLDRGVTDEEGRHTFGFGPPAPVGISASSSRHTPSFQVQTLRMREGDRHQVSFTLESCRGDIRVRVVDEDGDPVPGAQLTLYTSTETLDVADVGESGEHTFVRLFCGNYGVLISPPAGYTVPEGRGSSWIDGLIVENGGLLEAVFTVFPD